MPEHQEQQATVAQLQIALIELHLILRLTKAILVGGRKRGDQPVEARVFAQRIPIRWWW
jgi:hypothetical protein